MEYDQHKGLVLSASPYPENFQGGRGQRSILSISNDGGPRTSQGVFRLGKRMGQG